MPTFACPIPRRWHRTGGREAVHATQEELRAVLGRKIAERLGVPLSEAQRAEVGRAEVELLVPQVQPPGEGFLGLRAELPTVYQHYIPSMDATSTQVYITPTPTMQYLVQTDTVNTSATTIEWTGWNLTAQNTANDFWAVDPYEPRYYRYRGQWSTGTPVWDESRLFAAQRQRGWNDWHFTPPQVEVHATPEQIAEHRARVEARAEQFRVRAERAEALLVEHLNDVQRAEYAARREFHVVGSSGRRYCIRHGRAHNVFAVDDAGVKLIEFCGHVGEDVHDADNILAQKLMIETNEDAFRGVANASHLVGDLAQRWLAAADA